MPIRISNLRLRVDEPEALLLDRLAKVLGLSPEAVQQWRIFPKSFDARDILHVDALSGMTPDLIKMNRAMFRS